MAGRDKFDQASETRATPLGAESAPPLFTVVAQDDLRDLYKTLPVNATGRLEGTGDPALGRGIAAMVEKRKPAFLGR